MKRAITALLIAALISMGTLACSMQAPKDTQSDAVTTNPVNTTAAPDGGTSAPVEGMNEDMPRNDYNSALKFFRSLTDALCVCVDERINANNQKLEREKPNDYEQDPSYLILMYAPFISANMLSVPEVGDDADADSIVSFYREYGYENVKYTKIADGEYMINYSDTDEAENTTNIIEHMLYKDGSIRYEHKINDKTVEFIEFIDLGNDLYALQSMSDRAVVKYANGEIIEMLHSENRIELADLAYGIMSSWSVCNDPESDAAFSKTGLDENWVLEKNASNGIKRVFRFKDGTLNISGYNQEGIGEDCVFVEMQPIVIKDGE